MKLSTLSSVKKVLFSLEVFPPKKDTSVNVIYNTLLGLRGLPVDFISVTYGAGGSQVQKNKTCEIASLIRSNYHIEPVSHLTCVGSQKEDIAASLDALQENGVENILALRGDLSPDRQPTGRFPSCCGSHSFYKRICSSDGYPGSLLPRGPPRKAIRWRRIFCT